MHSGVFLAATFWERGQALFGFRSAIRCHSPVQVSAASFGDWVDQHPSLVRRVVIPSTLKWEIRDKLDQANITERVFHPGLDGLSRWLRRQYSPRTNLPADPKLRRAKAASAMSNGKDVDKIRGSEETKR